MVGSWKAEGGEDHVRSVRNKVYEIRAAVHTICFQRAYAGNALSEEDTILEIHAWLIKASFSHGLATLHCEDALSRDIPAACHHQAARRSNSDHAGPSRCPATPAPVSLASTSTQQAKVKRHKTAVVKGDDVKLSSVRARKAHATLDPFLHFTKNSSMGHDLASFCRSVCP